MGTKGHHGHKGIATPVCQNAAIVFESAAHVVKNAAHVDLHVDRFGTESKTCGPEYAPLWHRMWHTMGVSFPTRLCHSRF